MSLSHLTHPPHTHPHPWKSQTPGELQTLGNYPPSYRLLLHYLCMQLHKREGWMEGVGERDEDGWMEMERDQGRTQNVWLCVWVGNGQGGGGRLGEKENMEMVKWCKRWLRWVKKRHLWWQYTHFLTRLIYMSWHVQHMYMQWQQPIREQICTRDHVNKKGKGNLSISTIVKVK